jgi:hypothetical protein
MAVALMVITASPPGLCTNTFSTLFLTSAVPPVVDQPAAKTLPW